MGFWDLSDNTSAISDEKEYSAASADFDVIPKGSNVLVNIESADWKPGYQVSEEFVNLQVRVLKPEAYSNRVLFFKLWIDDLDPGVKTNGVFDKTKAVTKRDKHKKMLMAIDANAKGRLAKLTARPDNDQLAVSLIGSQFVASLGVWDKDVDGKKVPGGNWLMSASPKTKAVTEVAKPVLKPAASFVDDDDPDFVPF